MMQIFTRALGMFAVLLPFGGRPAAILRAMWWRFLILRRTLRWRERKGRETIVVAGGCFWGIQAVFERLKGVLRATSGYSGGAANTATYEKVCSGRTGHAEAVEVVFDPSQISVGQILKVFLFRRA